MVGIAYPKDCCTAGFLHKGQGVGTETNFAGYKTYITGNKAHKKVLILLSDPWGPFTPNTKLMADNFANQSYYVIAPDIYDGDYCPANIVGFDWWKWLENHSNDHVDNIVRTVIAEIKSELKPEFIGAVGYCLGAKFGLRQLFDKNIDVVCGGHPSLLSIEEIKQIKNPFMLSLSETDHVFTPEHRAAAELALAEIKADYYIGLHCGVKHSFCVKYDPESAHARVQAEKAFQDQLWFLDVAYNKTFREDREA